jgi:diguanylate cyclase (GGDEF)-like protein
MWITTTQGLSHLLDPSWVFENRPIDALVSRALLGARPVTGDPFAYTEDALSLQFGTSAYASERSIVFRYQLSGVDAEPVQSASGAVRYAFVPPGRHVLEVVAYDKLTHRSSPPTTLVVDVGYPWWRQSWAETLWAVLAAGAVQGFVTLRLRKVSAREAELKRLVLQATEKLRLDSLTGLLNRYEIERRLAERLACVKADDEVLVALLDIDHFKRVNDAYGHLGGDDVLRVVGALVSGTLRSGECAGRYGGEEMLLILEDADGRGAERLLNLHSLVRGTSFGANGRSIRLTCSIGLTWAVRGDDWDSLIGRADDALYEAKASGRDRVVERPRDLQVVRTAVNERRSSPETP